jgi:hexosaminidase
MKIKKITIHLILAAQLMFSMQLLAQKSFCIIPQPVSLEIKHGSFSFDNSTVIKVDKNDREVEKVVDFFKQYVKRVTGFELSNTNSNGKAVVFSIEKIEEIGDEGYLLSVNPNEIQIKGNTSI